MSMDWIKDTFGTEKPIIAMCHFAALPGDPYYDADGGMEAVVERARREFLDLQNGGVDAVMFSNEFSLPYLRKVNPETTAAMARIIGELKSEIRIPFGSHRRPVHPGDHERRLRQRLRSLGHQHR